MELSSEFPVRTLCRILEVPRSSCCYKSTARRPRDLRGLKAAILALTQTFRGCGVRPMYHLLNRGGPAGFTRSEIRRAYDELGILKASRPRKVKTTNSRHGFPKHPNLIKDQEIVRAHQVWVADVTYIRLPGRFAYLALLMDAYTRVIVGWALSLANDSQLTSNALEMGLKLAKPEIHHSDQGSNYASADYTAKLESICLSMAGAGKPQENGRAERLNRTIKEEEVRRGDYRNMNDAYEGMKTYIQHYNYRRLHSALGYRTPIEALQDQNLGPATP
jgi:putative transposase